MNGSLTCKFNAWPELKEPVRLSGDGAYTYIGTDQSRTVVQDLSWFENGIKLLDETILARGRSGTARGIEYALEMLWRLLKNCLADQVYYKDRLWDETLKIYPQIFTLFKGEDLDI